MKFADLHLHTYFSDGTYSPQELVDKSVSVGLSAIAIADHDSVEAIDEARLAGRKKEIEVIPAIELSCEYSGAEVHILGYFIDYKNKKLLAKLTELRKNRIERVHKMVAKLKELGLDLDAERIFAIANKGTVGRLHVARAMLKEGLISVINEAFQKYIGDKSPAYVAGFKLTPKEAIALIKGCSGVPVLAHPYTLSSDETLQDLIHMGIMGLEIYYPEHSQSMINYYKDIADKNGLLATGGSDCHGQAKPQVKIGSIKLPYEFVQKLKAASKK